MNARAHATIGRFFATAAASCMFAAWPLAAHACPMCFNGADQNQGAFLYATLFMMFVPTALIGSLVYWAYRRIRALESQPRELPPLPAHQAGFPAACEREAAVEPHARGPMPLRVVGR